MNLTPTDIRSARFPDDHAAVLAIFGEYVASPSVSLEYQDYESEFMTLPGKYAPPDGCLLLAWQEKSVVGCAALRRVDEQTCELKRVYVQPAARGNGLGRRLVEHTLATAINAGYRHVCLDVLPEFTIAQQLYTQLGFQPSAPVSFNPVPGTLFLGRELAPRDNTLALPSQHTRD